MKRGDLVTLDKRFKHGMFVNTLSRGINLSEFNSAFWNTKFGIVLEIYSDPDIRNVKILTADAGPCYVFGNYLEVVK